ncbi:YchJ family protein [Pseudonocardia bannensis]|uniref:UPF0225 protein HF519_18840 n=1 Tax=Pseudonocardia bannensis TaxID=630973 RepID=A0A848DMI5_9PSEU|nr:YchJ family metal-binding protein [Pseudonocardia bannensis]NMH93594.1 hypothetical protein [Pseudonocardia bannensis]
MRSPLGTPRPCPCGLLQTYHTCCGRFHAGESAAPTAELLMRSRFSAFAVGDGAYLLQTWHPSTRPQHLDLDPEQRWTELEILGRTGGRMLEVEGIVEFRAHYRAHGRPGTLWERSRFVREGGCWLYLDAIPR